MNWKLFKDESFVLFLILGFVLEASGILYLLLTF